MGSAHGQDHQRQQRPEGRQRPPNRPETPRAPEDTTPEPAQAVQRPPERPAWPVYMPVEIGANDMPLVGRWTRAALEALADRSPDWRRQWREMHTSEIEIVRAANATYAQRI